MVRASGARVIGHHGHVDRPAPVFARVLAIAASQPLIRTGRTSAWPAPPCDPIDRKMPSI
jgi:hypothetical protein